MASLPARLKDALFSSYFRHCNLKAGLTATKNLPLLIFRSAAVLTGEFGFRLRSPRDPVSQAQTPATTSSLNPAPLIAGDIPVVRGKPLTQIEKPLFTP